MHAAPIALEPSMSAEAALQAIGRACLSQLVQNEPATLAGDADGVHEMRVASRRLRSAIAAFGELLPEPERDWFEGELDRLDEVLGPARNLDVFAAELLAPCHAAFPREPALDRLAAFVEEARSAACRRVRALIRSPEHKEAVLRLQRWFEARGWRQGRAPCSDAMAAPIGDVAPGLLDRCCRKVRRRGKNFRNLAEKQRHRLRIALKQLRYAGELLGGLFDPRHVQGFGEPLKALQDDLGFANDVCVGRDILAELSTTAADKEVIEAAGRFLLDWHADRLRKSQRTARKQLRRLKDTQPFWTAPRNHDP